MTLHSAVPLCVLVLMILVQFSSVEAGERGDLRCTATVASDAVSVGEIISLTITVENLDAKAATVKEIQFGRNSLEAEILLPDQEESFTLTRIVGGVYTPKTMADETIEPGKSLTTTLEIPALVPGKLTITPTLWGKVRLDTLKVKVRGKHPASLKMETEHGDITIRLWTDVAPNTAHNIAMLAHQKFYDNLTFHRIMKGFMIQGGDPDGTGTGGPGFSLPAEFNNKPHVKGVFSMARSPHNDSAGSQFFLMHDRSRALDGKYTGFGEVIDGLQVVDTIANLPVGPDSRGEMSRPVKKPLIKRVRIITLK